LLEKGVLVHPGHFYEFGADDHIVLSLLAPHSTVAKGVVALLLR
jgi:hypothetical protein